MSGRTWKPEETQILKMTILDGLKENKQEKKLLIDAARRMGGRLLLLSYIGRV